MGWMEPLILLLPMIQWARSVRPQVALRRNHFFRAGAGRDHVPDRRDVRDGGVAAFPLRVQGCLIPAIVLLAFFKSMTPTPTHKCNKESGGSPVWSAGQCVADWQTTTLNNGKED